MLVEISVAVNYLLSHLYTKLPRRRVDSFGEELEKYLHAKFQNHWFPADPLRDAAFRCLNAAGPQVDLLLPEAAAVSGLDWGEIQACLPDGLVISVDPGHVACQYQQPISSNQELNRSSTAPFWPSASISLSSSGCSSASSSISSANLTPTSTQLAHQVLYCLQDSWMTGNGHSWYEAISNPSVKNVRTDSEGGNSLATATALSVLIDTEDRVASNMVHESAPQNFNSICLTRSLWNKDDPCDLETFESGDFQTVNSSLFNQSALKREYANGMDNMSPAQSFPWNLPDSNTDSVLGPLLNGDSLAVGHSGLGNERSSVVNRSLSNPPQLKQLTAQGLHDYVPATGTHCTNQPLNVDHHSSNVNALFSRSQPRPVQPFLSPCTNSNVNQFGQKSISTPSFTAATFAQTKFGSTKLKSHTKRNANRIISPTTVQQTFNAMNATPMIHREPLNSNGILNNQRILSNNVTESSAFRRFLPPSEVETKSGQFTDPFFQCDAVSSNLMENGTPGLSSESSLAQTLDNNRLLAMMEKRLSTQFDDFDGSCNADDMIQTGRFRKFNSIDSTEIAPSNYWTTNAKTTIINNNNSHVSAPTNTASTTTTASLFPTDWAGLHSQSVAHTAGQEMGIVGELTATALTNAKSNFIMPTNRPEDHTELSLDESFLSTRMVNMLLEEDGPSETSARCNNKTLTDMTSQHTANGVNEKHLTTDRMALAHTESATHAFS